MRQRGAAFPQKLSNPTKAVELSSRRMNKRHGAAPATPQANGLRIKLEWFLLGLLGASVATMFASGWYAYRAVSRAAEQVATAATSAQLADQLQQQASRILWGPALAALFLAGAGALWVQVLRHRRQLDEKRAGQRQLAALGRMSAVLAHEIRNPLASLKGHAQLLAEQLEEGSRTHRKAARVVQESQRLEELTNSLLDFVRAGNLERKMVEPVEVMRRAVDTINASRIVLKESDLPNWSLDPVRIEQVLLNLLRNALQADKKSTVRLSASVGSGGLVLKVEDDGPGLPEGGKHVFESFRTTKTRGTGLGLSVARRIVDLHQGSIQAVDLPTGGALFIVTIPPEGE